MKFEESEKILVSDLFMSSEEVISEFKKSNINQQDCQVLKLTGDASTRRYYRITCGKDSYVACMDRPLQQKGEEYPFCEVQSFLERHGIKVPHIYNVEKEKGFILEEDLGNKTLLSKLAAVKDKDEERQYFQKCLDLLVKLHGIPVSESDQKKVLKGICFDQEVLFNEIKFALEFFAEKVFTLSFSETDCKVIETEFQKICSKIAAQKMVFTHRDFHSRNIMSKGTELYLIDFQDARMGIPQYDLVSLLEDCYYQVDFELKRDMKEFYYHSVIKNSKLKQSKGEFEYLYDLTAIQRIFKAVGSFAYIFHLRSDKRYLKYIGFAMENLRSFLFKHSEFDELRTRLFSHYYEC